MIGTPLERFMAKIDTTSDCWLWTGKRKDQGYAVLWLDGRETRAHRWAYLHFVGPIPEGHELDHLCHTRHCVNPEHLEAVTHRVNTLRGSNSALRPPQTHCRRGHPLGEGATYADYSNGSRRCRVCRQAACKRYEQKRKKRKVLTVSSGVQ